MPWNKCKKQPNFKILYNDSRTQPRFVWIQFRDEYTWAWCTLMILEEREKTMTMFHVYWEKKKQ